MDQRSLRTDDSLEAVIRCYSEMVYRLAFARTGSKQDADDIYQEVFLRYIKKQPVFETEDHRKAWLIRVTVNCTKSFWTAMKRRNTDALETGVIDAANQGEIAFAAEADMALYHGLQQLPEKYREVVHLFYYEDLSIEVIGNILGRKKSTIRAQLTRARQRLKDILKEDYDEF